jgi:membrane-associated phospholipid phosphatase
MKALLVLWIIILPMIILSYLVIDRPLCDWVESHRVRQQLVADKKSPLSEVHQSVTGHSKDWKSLADWPPLVSNLSPFLILVAAMMRRGRARDLLLFLGLSILLSYVLKSELKLFFGRDWPITWQGNVHSWIKDHSYGFHLFRSALNQTAESTSSFPSGHAAIAFATFLPVGLMFRRALPWCLLAAICESAVMVMLNYHFLSDVLAGALLGISCMIVASRVMQVPRLGSVSQ